MGQVERHGVPYTREETTHWLSWIADGMVRHSEEIFLIENLQPSWITSRAQRVVYLVLSRALVLPLLLFFLAGLFGFLKQDGDHGWLMGVGLMLGSACLVILLDLIRAAGGWPAVDRRIQILFDLGLSFVVLHQIVQFLDARFDLVAEPDQYGVVLGLFFGIVWASRQTTKGLVHDIMLKEKLGISRDRLWKSAKQAGVVVGLYVIIVGAAILLFGTPESGSYEPSEILEISLALLLTGAIFGGIYVGFRSVKPGLVREKSRPNQGIRLTAIQSVKAFFWFGVVPGVAITCLFLLGNGEVAVVLFYVAYFSLMAWSIFGGVDVARHYCLRVVLATGRSIPLRLARFLDFASHPLEFLQPVGGGYLFLHRYLLLHFAELREGRSSPRAKDDS